MPYPFSIRCSPFRRTPIPKDIGHDLLRKSWRISIHMKNKQISSKRKGIYYSGMLLGVIGLFTFGSVFISGALHFGDFSDFEARTQSMGIRAVTGMGLAIAGGVLIGIGRAGIAGSGLVLDPQRARMLNHGHAWVAGWSKTLWMKQDFT